MRISRLDLRRKGLVVIRFSSAAYGSVCGRPVWKPMGLDYQYDGIWVDSKLSR